ncbi:MAG: hypothetical protein RLZZ337_1567 [Bacteroidota bacterium]|jgi:hypothetical protein
MRAKEFVTEQTMAQPFESGMDAVPNSLPGAYVQKQLRNTDPYMQYRYGVAVAAARAVQAGLVTFQQESPYSENLVQVMYAPEDEETIRLASKMMGVTPTKVDSKGSQEPKLVNKKSVIS